MIEVQINQSIELLKRLFGEEVLGIYLYGSAVMSGLQKYSDIDLFVVTNRATSLEEKEQLVMSLLQISGVYMTETKPPIELTIVVQSEVNPWQYPPKFDFQYGEWLREPFEKGEYEPWQSKAMPDLAVLTTQVLLSGKTLMGSEPSQLLPPIPYCDVIQAMMQALPDLMMSLESDTRNVLLTLARIWQTLETDIIYSKSKSADWIISHLPSEYHPVFQRAKSIYLGEIAENWDDLSLIIKPCADFIYNSINDTQSKVSLSERRNHKILLDKE